MSTLPPDGTPNPTPGPDVPPVYGSPAAPPPYGQPYPQQPVPAVVPLSPADERLWATLAHAGGILFGFLAPLVIWLIQKEKSAFVEDQAKEALNFQILVTIAYVAGSVLSFLIIPILLIVAAWICTIVFGIMGAMAANKGEAYRYPFNWRIIK